MARNIIKFTTRFLEGCDLGMVKVESLLFKTVTKNMTLTDHSLRDLARQGHPYSRRHPGSVHSPNYLVHLQSGRLVRGRFSGTEKSKVSAGSLKASAWVGIQGVYYAVGIIYGTSKMVPRDFLRGSLNEIRGQVLDILRGPMKNAVISFQGEKVKL